MTHEQYLAIYERERKKSSSVADAAHTIFMALNRDIAYRIEQKQNSLPVLLHWANTVWRFISAVHPELKEDGFKNMSRLHAEKIGGLVGAEVLKILDSV